MTIKIDGYLVTVDDEDYGIFGNGKTWHASTSGKGKKIYAWCWGKGKKAYLHRMINKTPEGSMTDHINGDTLDNSRANLRTCTYGENNANRGKGGNNKSGLKGAYWHKDGFWYSTIRVNKKTLYLGSFATKEEAHSAFAEASRKAWGIYAKTA